MKKLLMTLLAFSLGCSTLPYAAAAGISLRGVTLFPRRTSATKLDDLFMVILSPYQHCNLTNAKGMQARALPRALLVFHGDPKDNPVGAQDEAPTLLLRLPSSKQPNYAVISSNVPSPKWTAVPAELVTCLGLATLHITNERALAETYASLVAFAHGAPK